MTYQVTRTEKNEESTVFVMNNGNSVIFYANGASRCRNTHGRGLADNGRFAHVCCEMRRAVLSFRSA